MTVMSTVSSEQFQTSLVQEKPLVHVYGLDLNLNLWKKKPQINLN